jgi:serine/threonine protein phosphatase PrpC
MGGALTYLGDSAVTTVSTDDAEWSNKLISAGAASMQGWRRSMEDAHFMAYNEALKVYLFGVFDGHGGSGVSRYCAARLPDLIFGNPNFKSRNFDIALHESFLDIDSETQQPEVQERLFQLHIDSKSSTLASPEDRGKIEIHLSFETILDLFLGDPVDQANNPADPFKVFLEEYLMPNPFDIPVPPVGSLSQPSGSEEETSRKRKRRGYDRRPLAQYSAEPHSPWGRIASKLRQLIVDEKTNVIEHSEASILVAELRTLLERASLNHEPVPSLFGLKPDLDFPNPDMIFSDPLSQIFEGKLASLFHPSDRSWVYAIHPIDLLSVLNNDHMVEGRRCVSDDQGCTANVCLLDLQDEKNPILFCANAGDSRAILVRQGRAVPLSIDHKPGLPGERRRVLHAGGKVLGKADPRVQGDLNLSRAIGDWRHKQNASLPLELQMISPRPDISITELGKEDEYIFLGCDGIWERFSSSDCAAFVSSNRRNGLKSGLSENPSVCELASKICDMTVRKPFEFPGMPVGVTIGCDNMSVIIVRLGEELRKDLESDKELASSLPVMSFGAQVPEDWKPPGSGRSSPKGQGKKKH